MFLSKIKIIILTISVFIISILTISYLTPDYHPYGGLKLKLNKNEISEIGDTIILTYKPELRNEKRNISLESNPAILRWLRNTNRIDPANRKIREQKLSYYWLVRVLFVNDTNLLITSDKDKNLETTTFLELKVSLEGKLSGLSEDFNETKVTNNLTEDSARIFLESTITSLSDFVSFTNDSNRINFKSNIFSLYKIELIQKLNRKDHNFNWKGFDESIKLEKGNTFVFYTDGFTEAINSKGEEFGLERIQKLLEQYSYEPAHKILGILLAERKKFVDKIHQYDDMTMVIVKVSS